MTTDISELHEFLPQARERLTHLKATEFVLAAKTKLLLSLPAGVETAHSYVLRGAERCAAVWLSRAAVQVFSVPGGVHAHPIYVIRTAEGDDLCVTQAAGGEAELDEPRLLARVQQLMQQRRALTGANAGGAAAGVLLPLLDIDTLTQPSWSAGLQAASNGRLHTLAYAAVHVRMRLAWPRSIQMHVREPAGVQLNGPLLVWLLRPRLPHAPLVAALLLPAHWRKLHEKMPEWDPPVAASAAPVAPSWSIASAAPAPPGPFMNCFPMPSGVAATPAPAPSPFSLAAAPASAPSKPSSGFALNAPASAGAPATAFTAFAPTPSPWPATPAPSATATATASAWTLPSAPAAASLFAPPPPAASVFAPLAPAALPSATSSRVHKDVSCDQCRTSPIIGVRYKCVYCPDYDLCEQCTCTRARSPAAFPHPATHLLLRIDDSASEAVQRSVLGQNRSALVHNVKCHGCDSARIVGARYKCAVCPECNLCEACEAMCRHSRDHPLLKTYIP